MGRTSRPMRFGAWDGVSRCEGPLLLASLAGPRGMRIENCSPEGSGYPKLLYQSEQQGCQAWAIHGTPRISRQIIVVGVETKASTAQRIWSQRKLYTYAQVNSSKSNSLYMMTKKMCMPCSSSLETAQRWPSRQPRLCINIHVHNARRALTLRHPPQPPGQPTARLEEPPLAPLPDAL